ncbi:MAG: hypothetical protein ACXW30_02540 [Micavibrio sp.]
MSFPFYILIAIVVYYYRYRHLTGGYLKKGSQAEEGDCLTPSYRGPSYLSPYSDGYIHESYFGLKLDGTVPFIIKPASWYDRILMRYGLVRGLSTEFHDIDQKLFIMTDDPERCSALFQDQEFRQSIVDLFNLPVKALYSLENRIWIKAKQKMFEHHDNVATAYRQRMMHLRKIRDKIQESGLKAGKNYPPSPGHKAFRMISLHSALFVSGMLTFIFVVSEHALVTVLPASALAPNIIEVGEFIQLSGLVGLGMVVAWLVFIVRSFSGKSWFGWVVADFMIFGFIGIILTSGYVLRETNIRLDFTSPEIIERPVVDRVCTLGCRDGTGKGAISKIHRLQPEECVSLEETIRQYSAKDPQCTYDHSFDFYIDFPDISDNQWPQLFRVHTDQKVYLAAERGMMLSIPVHQGLFGIQWTNRKEVGRTLTE